MPRWSDGADYPTIPQATRIAVAEIGGRTTRDRAGIRRAQTPRWRDIDGRVRIDGIHPLAVLEGGVDGRAHCARSGTVDIIFECTHVQRTINATMST